MEPFIKALVGGIVTCIGLGCASNHIDGSIVVIFAGLYVLMTAEN